ncbi:hypothetical protein SGCOL_001327 [Colletotrichum sp. CLE4]
MSASPVEGSDEWKAQDKGQTIVIVCWIVTAISTCFVVGRVYFCGYISMALSTIAVTYGNGRHMSLLSTEQQQGAILWTTAAFFPGIMSFGLPKLAVVSLLVRSMNPDRYHKWFLRWLGIWCQLTLFVTAGLLLGRCMPARSLWDFSVEGTCFDVGILVAYCIYAGSFSAFVDVYLAVYPAVVLFRLQMATKKKIALSCALCIGSISAKGSKQTPQYYEDYGSQSKSKSRGGGGIELGQRKTKAKPKYDLGLTIVEGDGQENILTPTTDSNHGMYASSCAPTLNSRQSDSSQHPADGKIIRTDFVSVTYEEQGPARDTSASSRWRARIYKRKVVE